MSYSGDPEVLKETDRLFAIQDDFLVGLTSIPPRLDRDALYSLPPWRAAMFARVACMAGQLHRRERDNIVREARLTGGDGALKPWDQRTGLEREFGVHAPWTPKAEE